MEKQELTQVWDPKGCSGFPCWMPLILVQQEENSPRGSHFGKKVLVWGLFLQVDMQS